MKLIASNQMTLTNLLEKAETRKETFYKLTNSADVPTAPSEGGRNLYALSKNSPIGTNHIGNFNQNVSTGEISFKVTGQDPFFGTQANKGEVVGTWRGIKIPVKTGQDIAVQLTNELFIKNYVSYFGKDDISVKNFKGYQANNFIIPATELEGVSYVTFRFGIKENTQPIGSIHSTKVKVEYGNAYTEWAATPEDLSWSMDTLVPTQTNRYLWKFEYIYYSDGSVEVTQPVNISIAGADGTNGQNSHVHFAFADNATGGGFSLTTPKAYMGWYADFNESASNDPTKYKWGKWKGDQGVPGRKGDDGKTSYLHLAYASSADGKTGFSFTDTKQQYQGYYTDFTQTSSTDPTKYTWMDRRAGIEVGGRNLFLNSKFNFELTKQYSTYYMDASQAQTQGQLVPSIDKNTTFKGANTLKIVSTFNGTRNNQKITFRTGGDDRTGAVDEMKNQSVMMSFWAKSTVANTIMSWRTGFRNPTKELTIGTDWTYYSFQLIAPENSNATNEAILHIWTVATVWVAFPKVERGTISTDHSEAPEDIQADIDSKADQALTQQQLEALEAKRQQMIVEIEAKATLEQVSELTTFLNNLKKEDTDGRQKIIEITKAIEERVKDIEPIMEYSQKLKFVDTYITQGNGGMIIGANDSTTKVVVTPNRISFQDGGSEVAYISQSVLHIDNGVFTMSLQLGHFITRAHPKNQYVNGTYFVK
ncbi:hypothetical protein Si036_01151 [Streptococcus infantarius subsp. infantarius]|nr:hypothetical protein [Streptococcus infantarius subsp. infantarius]